MKNVLNTILGALSMFISYYLGGWDVALQTLVIVVAIDYITGVSSGVVNKELNSKTSIRGLLKKMCYLVAVMFGYSLDKFLGVAFIRVSIIYFLIANDGISIVENLAKIGVPLPKVLINVLEQMKEKGDEGDVDK